MYTLEDDHETSSRLNKRDVINAAEGQTGTFGEGNEVLATEEPLPGQPSSSFAKHFSKEQLTSSFKKLATPGKSNAGIHVSRWLR